MNALWQHSTSQGCLHLQDELRSRRQIAPLHTTMLVPHAMQVQSPRNELLEAILLQNSQHQHNMTQQLLISNMSRNDPPVIALPYVSIGSTILNYSPKNRFTLDLRLFLLDCIQKRCAALLRSCSSFLRQSYLHASRNLPLRYYTIHCLTTDALAFKRSAIAPFVMRFDEHATIISRKHNRRFIFHLKSQTCYFRIFL